MTKRFVAVDEQGLRLAWRAGRECLMGADDEVADQARREACAGPLSQAVATGWSAPQHRPGGRLLQSAPTGDG